MRILFTLVASIVLCGVSFAQDVEDLQRALANPDRPDSDKQRDDIRKAPQLLQFMGVEEGDTALDVIAMGGWYSEVLSYAVGPGGRVIMHNNPIPITERSADERAERRSRLANVEDYIGSIDGLDPNSVDFAITALNFHDVYNRSAEDAQVILKSLLTVLKPGAILAIIDHAGTEGADNPTLHRIAFADAVTAATNAGFMLVGTSDLLANPADDHSLGPFDPSLERRTDRFVLKLAKPR